MDSEIQKISLLVKGCRKKAGLTQQSLAELSGVGKTAIFDIEKGKTSIQFDTLIKVLNVLNIQIHFVPPVELSYEKS